MEQTPVEWLIDESMKLVVQYMNGTLNEETLDDDIYRIGTRAKEMEKEQFGDETYSEIEHLIIAWEIDGTKTAGHLTRQIMKLLNK